MCSEHIDCFDEFLMSCLCMPRLNKTMSRSHAKIIVDDIKSFNLFVRGVIITSYSSGVWVPLVSSSYLWINTYIDGNILPWKAINNWLRLLGIQTDLSHTCMRSVPVAFVHTSIRRDIYVDMYFQFLFICAYAGNKRFVYYFFWDTIFLGSCVNVFKANMPKQQIDG